MKSLAENLTQYAACHRDRRNIATHFLGIPLIVFAIVLALALVSFPAVGVSITLAAATSVAAGIYYLKLDLVFGLAMSATLFVLCAAASEITARAPAGTVLAAAAVLFSLGWALQFWGHRFEGMKPAFFDDARQLLIGPLFLLAEIFFLFGARPELRGHIEARVGPVVSRRSQPARNTP